jgi:hypothetical protein
VLGDHFAPVTAEPVPESLTLMIAAAAAEETERDMTDAAQAGDESTPKPASVLDFGAARARRQAAAKAAAKTAAKAAAKAGPKAGSRVGSKVKFVNPANAARMGASGTAPRNWGMGVAIAASLVVGVMLGSRFAQRDMFTQGAFSEQGGVLVASGALAKGLDTRLASDAGDAGDLRVLTSFRRAGGDICRVFDGGATAGIACRDDGRWVLERTVAGAPRESGEYRQAGSAQGDLLAAAQEMAAGEPLDAAQERAAREKGWHGR